MKRFLLTLALCLVSGSLHAQVVCSNPDGLKGEIIYNSSEKVFQGCTPYGWYAFHDKSSCPTMDLVAHWAFNETSGTAASDSAGTYNGTLTNMDPATDWVSGKLGNALEFDGSNDYVDVSSLGTRTYDNFSIASWYKSSNLSMTDDEYILIIGQVPSSNAIIFAVGDDTGHEGEVRIYMNNDGTGYFDFYSTGSPVHDQQWHHLAMVRTASEIVIYVDGLEITRNADIHTGVSFEPENKAYIGDDPGKTEQVNGLIDDLRIYSRALTSQEISDLYNGGSGCQ